MEQENANVNNDVLLQGIQFVIKLEMR